MSRLGIIVNVDKCIGCHACFVACKQENQVAPGIQWNRIRKVENIKANIINYYRASCQHCDEPACLAVCPVKAVFKGSHGEVLVDHAKCIGCKACLVACPFDAPKFNEAKVTSYFGDKEPLFIPDKVFVKGRIAGKAEHCTLCFQRLEQNKEPACIEVCPASAITLVDYDRLTPDQEKMVQASVALKAAKDTKPKVRYICSNMDFSQVSLK